MSDRGSKNAGFKIAGAIAATLAVGALALLDNGAPIPGAAAEPSTSTSTTASATTSSTTTASSSENAGQGAGEFPSDDHGYLDSEARCDDGQTLMILGRTSRSLVAVCVGPDGQLEYRGVRLSDQAGLTMGASRGDDGDIVAVNDDVTYSISPKAFVVSEGDTVIYQDSWAEYHQPGFSSGATSTTSASTTTTTATPTTTSTPSGTPTISTTTVTLPPTTSTQG